MASVTLVDRDRTGCEFVRRAYWQWLLRPWKLATFGVATAAVMVLASYSHDPAWDSIDAGMVSVFTFLTAPYAVATLYRRLRGVGATWDHAALSVCLWFLSTSWFPDLYLLWRDGHYPVTWYGNLIASSALYCGAGLFWSLDRSSRKGTTFAFTLLHWPTVRTSGG
jgi:hypothetical protein